MSSNLLFFQKRYSNILLQRLQFVQPMADRHPIFQYSLADIEVFLKVGLALLTGSSSALSSSLVPSGGSPVEPILNAILKRSKTPLEVSLFGTVHQISYLVPFPLKLSLMRLHFFPTPKSFIPRGRYATGRELKRFFRAWTWFSMIRLNFDSFDLVGSTISVVGGELSCRGKTI